MAAQSSKILMVLEGKLGMVRREVEKMLQGLKRDIGAREAALAALKADYTRGLDLLRGKATPKAAPVARRPKKRARAINWKAVFSGLPIRFNVKTLTSHPIAGKRPKPHLYAVVARWKKEGLVKTDGAGGYQKAGAKPARPKKARRKIAPKVAPKPAPKPAAKAAPKPAQPPQTESQ
jgi:hypothetical protein